MTVTEYLEARSKVFLIVIGPSSKALARSRPEIIVRSGNKVGKYFRINPASHVGA